MKTPFNNTQNLPPSHSDCEALASLQSLQQRLEVTEARNRQLLESLPQIIWLAQVNGEITEFNRRWYDYTGLTAVESLGWGFLKALHPEDRDRFIALCNLAQKTPQRYQLECRLLGVDGTYRWFTAQKNSVLGTDGKVLEWIGTYTQTGTAGNPVLPSTVDTSTQPLRQVSAAQPKELSVRNQEPATLRVKKQAIPQVDELAKHRLRNLLKELSHTIVWEADATSEHFTFVSQSAERVLGYPIQQWLSEPNFWVNLIHPEDRQWTVALQSKEICHSRDYELEYRCLAADNRVVWLRDRGCVIRDDQGQVHKRRGMMVDITLAKLAEAELQIRRRQQNVVVQLSEKALLGSNFDALMDEGVALVSQALAVEYCKVLECLPDGKNFLLKAGAGWRDGVVGQAMVEASPNTHAGYTLHCRQPVVVEDLYRERRFRASSLLHDHNVVSGMSVVIEGHSQQENVKETPLKHHPFGILGAHSSRRRKFSRSDVDFLQSVAQVLATAIEQQRSNQALDEARRQLAKTREALNQTKTALKKRTEELEQFAYIASHDLKAPLRAIANLSQWIEEDIADQLNQENFHQMQLLRGRVERLDSLIDGLLQYSRAGRVKVEPEWVDVGELLNQVIDTLTPPPEFTIVISPGMPNLLTERLQLKQVFHHLIGNAIAHHPTQAGTVTISIQEHTDRYEFTVADDGAGIAPDFHERVFVIFQTLQAPDKAENIGMGLAIAKKIVESQGGIIQVDSQEGQGAKFNFTWHK